MTPLRNSLRPSALLTLALAAALVIPACGGEEKEAPNPEAAKVRRVVNIFASGDNADACDLLTDELIESVYRSRASCVEKAQEFVSGTVNVDDVKVSDRGVSARVKASSLDGKQQYIVRMKKVQLDGGCSQCTTQPAVPEAGSQEAGQAVVPPGDWLIAEIDQIR